MTGKVSFITAAIALVLVACSPSQKQNASDVLNNTELQNEIMDSICNSHDRMTNMMDHMMASDHAMDMLSSNKELMHHMMKAKMSMMHDSASANKMMDHMMSMMEKDSNMCKTMCDRMMDNPDMKSHMMHKMEMNKEGAEGEMHQHKH